MKKEIVNYKNGEFVDYMGNTHKFVVAAVSTSNFDISLNLYNDFGDFVEERSVPKGIFIGIAICNPKDEFDLEKGKMIAYNKAVGMKNLNHPAMYSARPGFINTEVVDALLNNIVNYVKKDPGSVIEGYDDAKKKYMKKLADQEFLSNSSETLKKLATDIKSLTSEEVVDLNKLIELI